MTIISPPSRTTIGALTINALGDSISNQSAYFPYGVSLTTVPVWHTSIAVTLNSLIRVGTMVYRCTTAGTTASTGSGPTGTGSSINDGSAVWAYLPYTSAKQNTNYLYWAEAMSLGRLTWDMSDGYAGTLYGTVKVAVVSGGNNYAATDTVSIQGGGTASITVNAGGAITSVTVTNPGYNSAQGYSYTINTSTGSGAVLAPVICPGGTYSVPGCTTVDMVAHLPDAVSARADIMMVFGGTNDINNNTTSISVANSTAAAIIANLRTCYETLMNAGKKVIAVPILPRYNRSVAQIIATNAVNRWIRAYCRKESWANPNGQINIALADPTGYFADGTNAAHDPIGGIGNNSTAGAMTQDGIHPSARGAYYFGYAVWQAAQQFLGTTPTYGPRNYQKTDYYDAILCPGGNLLEPLPWQASTAVIVGQLAQNGGNIYACTAAGTTASSGGPTGTGTSITDGTAVWYYMKPTGRSVLGSGITGSATAATGISFSGALANGFGFSRLQGSASGTVTFAIENPWSNGQVGQRQSIVFSLGSGTVGEQWAMTIHYDPYARTGILPSDLGSTKFYLEAEVEISNVVNMEGLRLQAQNDADQSVYSGVWLAGSGARMAGSSEMVPYPNGGKLLLKSPVFTPTPALSTHISQLQFWFDASGSAGSATATVKVNYLALRRYGVA